MRDSTKAFAKSRTKRSTWTPQSCQLNKSWRVIIGINTIDVRETHVGGLTRCHIRQSGHKHDCIWYVPWFYKGCWLVKPGDNSWEGVCLTDGEGLAYQVKDESELRSQLWFWGQPWIRDHVEATVHSQNSRACLCASEEDQVTWLDLQTGLPSSPKWWYRQNCDLNKWQLWISGGGGYSQSNICKMPLH